MFGKDYATLDLEDKFFDLQLGLVEQVYSRDILDATHVYLNPLALSLVSISTCIANLFPFLHIVCLPDAGTLL